jgi:hypothetical protein
MLKYVAALCRVYRLMASPLVTPAVIADLRAELILLHAQAALLPPMIWRQPLHYTMHFPEQMLLFGPTTDHSMWSYESMFGYLKGLLKSRKHPIANILKAWGLGFALQTIKGRLHHSKYMAANNGNPPEFTPDNRSRMHKDATLGPQKKAPHELDPTRCAQVRAWYQQQPPYAEMERLHAVAKDSPECSARYNPDHGFLFRMLILTLCDSDTLRVYVFCQQVYTYSFTNPLRMPCLYTFFATWALNLLVCVLYGVTVRNRRWAIVPQWRTSICGRRTTS